MKREDFKAITKEHIKTAEAIVKLDGNCDGISCRICPFSSLNMVNGTIPHCDSTYERTLEEAKEFLKLVNSFIVGADFRKGEKAEKVIYRADDLNLKWGNSERPELSSMAFNEKIKLLLNSKSDSENKVRIIEELAELQKEIAKDLRNCLSPETRVTDYENILEEFADVVIELHMLKEIYYIDDEILEKAVNEKMEKNLNRIGIYRNPTTL